jgi:hypothetical protein
MTLRTMMTMSTKQPKKTSSKKAVLGESNNLPFAGTVTITIGFGGIYGLLFGCHAGWLVGSLKGKESKDIR